MSRFFSYKDYLSILRSIFVPKFIYEHVEDINLDELLDLGINVLFLDIDNTVVALSERKISLKRLNWLERAKMLGFRVYFVSNNSSFKRIEAVCQQAKLTGIYFACKPFVFSTKEFMQKQNVQSHKLAVVGDQLFTDVILGNWLGACAILVDPIDKRLSFFKTFQRQIELQLLTWLRKH